MSGEASRFSGRDKLGAVATLFSTLPGMKLYFRGQFEGRHIRMPLQIRQTADEPAEPGIRDFYERLLPIVSREIFHSGRWELKGVRPAGDGTSDNLIAYLWKYGGQAAGW